MAFNALFIGSTALAANSTALDVIGQNLANLNTTGFKTQRAQFKDAVYQTLNFGSAPANGSGGVNPVQSGSGVSVGTVASLFQQGTITPTGRALDAAIQGSGFFVLSNGVQTVYSRAGTFEVDADGFLVDPNTGFRLQRSGSVGEGTATEPPFQAVGNLNIRVPIGAAAQGIPTSTATYQGNLSSTLDIGASVPASIQVYDAQGTPRSLDVLFTKSAANTFDVTASIAGGTATVPPGTQITFDASGFLSGPASVAVSITGLSAPQTVTLNLGTPGTASGLTQFGGASTATAVTQNGSGFGTLTGVSFDLSGQLIGQFSNGRSIPIAQLAIAGFNNEGGLLRTGNNYFITSPASGEAVIGPAGVGGRGVVQGGSLEGSNVDIAGEFARLIIAQRGFQVNTQTISAVNQTLQELVQIIR